MTPATVMRVVDSVAKLEVHVIGQDADAEEKGGAQDPEQESSGQPHLVRVGHVVELCRHH